MQTIFNRRSVRVFTDKAVENEKIEKILRAAMQAPSAMNQQPWEFIVVSGKENLESLSGYNPNAKPLKTATAAIIVLANADKMKVPRYWQQDLARATQNIMLEAAHLGLGSVWLGTAPNEDRIAFIEEIYNLDENLTPFSVIALGYPTDENANHFVDRFDASCVRYIK